ncbi:MAG: bifunctional adenosylcobinamide kinase/adenosylcobinamide-phosphate guanylyltransferase [Hydrogenophaga sp.]|uniref:bifunctional adenosylcobinamide kinase/adenosylcobinamide-phosphate guanylyltransferase n=1 Tax=Hydrogenophaga sp. TaxID=1904254 RepID=UPI001D373329|nr:bifunctional adenosylcobinamide kinase/adenosylcobinamide-phosphate guanylyltransferase [Hydrogenophaga sp.]MBX3609797.1 bifunctional adenosylcobinamide kinase/adenosylcobinamide-phosphate guanylyltransferase [Hydrogenophaga sp.]
MAEAITTELILGGQKSGKSRLAESRAQAWLAASPAHRATFVATAVPGDAEMGERIRRHQQDRAARLPGIGLIEEPLRLADAIARASRADTLVLVDCLTLWLTHHLMPMRSGPSTMSPQKLIDGLCDSLRRVPGPVVLVSNEIGLGVVPLGAEVRGFVDTLGRLNQAVAAICPRVTLMAAGLPLGLKTP